MKYRVKKRFGKYNVGSIVDDKDLYIRRKLQEGGCLEEIKNEKNIEKKDEKKEDKDGKKMVKNNYENKMLDNKEENK